MAYAGLSNVLEAEAHGKAEMQRLADVQFALTRLGRDLEQAVARPIRDEFGDRQAALVGGEHALSFTRAGWSNPLQQQRSQLQRVAWSWQGESLLRVHWSVLDRAQDSQTHQADLLQEITALRWRYLDAEGEWQTQWPAALANGPATAQTLARLPRAVEVQFEFANWGELRRLFELPANPVIRNEKSASEVYD